MFKFVPTYKHACLLLIFAFMGMAGCNQQDPEKKFHSTNITGANFGKILELTDHTGKARTLADFKGKLVAISFGYTHCPDVCPTTLSDMAQAVTLLGKDADKVQVLFVTVDPVRDTQTILAHYVPAFNPDFIGLYGDETATLKVAREFHVFFQKQQAKNDQNYNVDHTAGSFVLDRSGNLRLSMRYGLGAESIAHDLRILLLE